MPQDPSKRTFVSALFIMRVHFLTICSLACLLVSFVPAHAQRTRIAPEAATGRSDKTLATARHMMVTAANPLAVRAGMEMLEAGGTAIDAAIAVQLVLNIVEPQSSGIGGGAFLLHWDKAARVLRTYDGRETAPASAEPDRFFRDGKPLPFSDVVKSGLSVGVPGLMRLLEHVHTRHGKLPWPRLFEPAIRLATDGFRVSPRLSLLLYIQGRNAFAPDARRFFFDGSGTPRPAGHLLRNPAFAATLHTLRTKGASAFYEGPIAEAIVAAVRSAPRYRGDITLADLKSYTMKERPPVCFKYRMRRICGMGPPSSGALTIGQTLRLLEPFDMGQTPRDALRPRLLHLIAEAEKLAFADRNRYIADPDFVAVPTGLLDPDYLARRRQRIAPLRAMSGIPPAGRLPGHAHQTFGHDATRESVGTSHISIIDAQGNAVSMTTTIESAFGSGVWAAGFLLNNELTDFSFRARDRHGRPIANRIEGGKRPRSSMSPTIVFDDKGTVSSVLGSPGGSRIILYVIKALVGMIDWKLDPYAAAAMINFGSRGAGFELEYDAALTTNDLFNPWKHVPAIWHAIRLKPYGHTIRPDFMTSGLHIIARRDGVLFGAADPRREGDAQGR